VQFGNSDEAQDIELLVWDFAYVPSA